MDAVGHMLAAQSLTPRDQAELDEDLAAWGITPTPANEPDIFEVWHEHKQALLWWCQGGGQLKFNGLVCTGLDVLALQADASLSGRTIAPDDYQRMQLIARQVAAHLNSRTH